LGRKKSSKELFAAIRGAFMGIRNLEREERRGK